MATELEAIGRPTSMHMRDRAPDYTYRDKHHKHHGGHRSHDGPLSGESRQAASSPLSAADTFAHTELEIEQYANYNSRGEYTDVRLRILPRRYYEAGIGGNVYYKGGTVSYLEFLEGAVAGGAITLDEDGSVWDNLHQAEKVLIYDKAKTLYPWATTLYSEDTQYRLCVTPDGDVTTVPAFYTAPDGTRITVEDLAEQLASGVRPEDMPGDGYRLLWDMDRELCTKARMIGQAVRSFRTKDQAYAEGRIDEQQYLNDVRLYMVYFLGRDEGQKTAEQLRAAVEDPLFPRKALKGQIAAAAPSAVYRRPVLLRNAYAPPTDPNSEIVVPNE